MLWKRGNNCSFLSVKCFPAATSPKIRIFLDPAHDSTTWLFSLLHSSSHYNRGCDRGLEESPGWSYQLIPRKEASGRGDYARGIHPVNTLREKHSKQFTWWIDGSFGSLVAPRLQALCFISASSSRMPETVPLQPQHKNKMTFLDACFQPRLASHSHSSACLQMADGRRLI